MKIFVRMFSLEANVQQLVQLYVRAHDILWIDGRVIMILKLILQALFQSIP